MHQFLFYIGDFPIRSYGVVLSLSIFLATGVGYFMAKVDGHGYEKFLIDIGLIGGFFGLLGARLWDVFFFDWSYYQNHLDEILNVWQGGMAVQGGIILGVTAGALYAKSKKLDVIHLADILAPAIVLGQALGRCANLLNGDAFGAPTGGNFGIIYPETTLAYRTYGNQPLFPAEVWECQLDVVKRSMFRAVRHALRGGEIFSGISSRRLHESSYRRAQVGSSHERRCIHDSRRNFFVAELASTSRQLIS